MPESWRSYETKVTEVLKRIDPRADIQWNKRVRDRRTGSWRQIDVWIEAIVATHKIKIVGSCKHLARKIHSGDIDHLKGEMAAVGAHTGIMFSRKGFADTAIAAAKAEGISCCLLADTMKAEFLSPASLRYLLARIQAGVIAFPTIHSLPLPNTWREFLSEEIDGQPISTVADVVSAKLNLVVAEIARQRGNWLGGQLEPGVLAHYEDFTDHKTGRSAVIEYAAQLLVYESIPGSMTASGVINVTDGAFWGNLYSPAVDSRSPHPGPGWRELGPSETKGRIPAITCMVMQPTYDVKFILDTYGPRQLGLPEEVDAARRRFRGSNHPRALQL